jgi:hypothetical protein
MFSAFWAVLAFVAVLIFASGGAFIVTLVMAAMFSMSYKGNDEHLGKGSGINLSSRKPASRPGGYPPRPGSEAPGTNPDGTAGDDFR